MSIGFNLNRSKYDDRIRKMEQIFHKKLRTMKIETEKKTRIVAARMCQDLVYITMPSEASGIGKAIANIKYDFRRIYKTPGDVYEEIKSSNGHRLAAAFYAAYKKGDHARAESFLRKSTCSLRSLSFGHAVNEDGQEIISGRPAIISEEEMQIYLKLVVKRLGKTASGWGACLKKLGFGEGVRWKSTDVHGADGGDVNIINDKHKVTYRIVNLRPLARKLLNPSDLSMVIKEGREELISLLKKR